MNRKNAVDQLRAHGALAGHLNDRYVESVRDVPRRVKFALPLFQDRPQLKKGDRIAIVDLGDQLAFLCRIREVKTGLGAPVFELEGARRVRLE